jgi:hypothetical protein
MPFVANPGKAATDLIGEPLAELLTPARRRKRGKASQVDGAI